MLTETAEGGFTVTGERVAFLPFAMAAKAALYLAMQEAGGTTVALANSHHTS